MLAGAVALPLWTLAAGNGSHATALILPDTTPTPASVATASPSIGDAGTVSLQAPIIKQDLALDCESAALQVALAVKNIDVPQDTIFYSLPQQPQPVQMGADGYPVRWGDPYTGFVGDVNGYEPSFTGYGVYYPPIVAAAEHFGATAVGRTGWTVAEIVAQLREGNSVVVWLTSDFKAHVPRFWTAWDGRRDSLGCRRARGPGDRLRPRPEHDHLRGCALRRGANHVHAGVRRCADHVWRHGGRRFLSSAAELDRFGVRPSRFPQLACGRRWRCLCAAHDDLTQFCASEKSAGCDSIR